MTVFTTSPKKVVIRPSKKAGIINSTKHVHKNWETQSLRVYYILLTTTFPCLPDESVLLYVILGLRLYPFIYIFLGSKNFTHAVDELYNNI